MNRIHDSRGVTLSELMVATVILSVGIMGMMGTFQFVTKGVSSSRQKTIAANLTQEEMEVLKNLPYTSLIVTTQSAVSTGFNPNFTYDVGTYTPQTINQWGLPTFTRVVEVDYASVSGLSVSTIAYSSSDPGMKKITVTTYWSQNGVNRKIQYSSYYENPSVATLDTGFTGTVNSQGGAALASALVQVVGVPKWRGYTDVNGNFTFSVAPGSYTVIASSAGYQSAVSAVQSVAEGVYTAVPTFTLIPIASGTVASASVYASNPDLVISQIVASTVTPNGGAGYDTQYVELFNSTTHQINLTSLVPPASGAHSYKLNLNSAPTDTNYRECQDVQLMYVSSYVAAGSYYVVANTVSFVINGSFVKADAYYTDTAGSVNCIVGPAPGIADWNPPSVRRILQSGTGGSVWLQDYNNNQLDAVGWGHMGKIPSHYSGTYIPDTGGGGFKQSDQIVRFSTPCANLNSYGSAYNSGSNNNDFYYNAAAGAAGLIFPIHGTSSGIFSIIAGKPGSSGRIFANDGNSAGAATVDFNVSGTQGQVCPVSSFTMVGMATGTWSVSVISQTAGSSVTVGSVVVSQGVTTWMENAATNPAWAPSGLNYTVLTTSYAAGAYITGVVYGAGADQNTRLSGILVGSDTGVTTRTDSQGSYFLVTSTGVQTVTANYNTDNALYTTSNQSANPTAGNIQTLSDFHLSKGAVLKGYLTTGTGAVPNIVVSAVNSSGLNNTDTSDTTGHFYIFASTTPTTNPYSISPTLDPLQSYSSAFSDPSCSIVGSNISCPLATPGTTVFVGTFTIVGAMATISGTVKNNSQLITTGVLVLASVAAISDPPPAVVASSAAALTPVYAASSQADGTYSISVRSSTGTAYNVRAWFPQVSPQTGVVTYTSKYTSGAGTVGAGGALTVPFTWP